MLGVATNAWKTLGACRDDSTAVYYPGRELSSRSADEDYRRARMRCAECPVAMNCLLAALQRPERYGVWGGLDPRERTTLMDRLGTPAMERIRSGEPTDADWQLIADIQARRLRRGARPAA